MEAGLLPYPLSTVPVALPGNTSPRSKFSLLPCFSPIGVPAVLSLLNEDLN
jgi:hypothetical protein